jgi:DHA2 family methylenomycin A resistance protein-like MFS transporter
MMQTTAVNVALPALGAAFHDGLAGLQWCVNGYAIAFGAMLLPLGALVDRRGARFLFMGGLALFLVASLVSGLAPSVPVLVAGQVLAGVASAMIAPSAMSLVGQSFQDARSRTHAVGAMSLGLAAGFGAGPVVGGALIGWLGWQAVFLVNVPAALVIVALTWMHVPAGVRRLVRAPSLIGVVLGIAALGLVTLALIEGGEQGWADSTTWIAFASAVVCCVAFVVFQRSSASPLVPRRLLTGSDLSTAAVLGMTLNFAVYGIIFVFSLYLQHILHLSPLQTGLVFLPQPVGTASVAISTSRWVARVGPRSALVLGWAFMATGTAVLLVWGTHGSLPLTAVGLFLAGIAGGLIVPALNAAIVVTSPQELVGVAAGGFNAARQVGSALGVAILGSIAGGSEVHVQAALAVAAVAELGAIAIALRFVTPERFVESALTEAVAEASGADLAIEVVR